ncbi:MULTISPECIES: sulfotransferase family protein [Mesorhizobium]|uniref:sulfotransferase family protein n=1 Tax=Mesorhizobium TaxID=68287 RepID=UPI0010A963D5|nr:MULTISPECIES: sulfotransferase [Mesorhizobium]
MIRHPSSESLCDAVPPAAGEVKPAAVRRTCIIVLGMHRSGTSALARAISLLGAGLPKNMLGANPTNETGHWEPLRLMELHDRMLAEAGSRWDDWRPFEPADLGASRLRFYEAEIGRLIDEEYGSAPLFVLKDPRISRFVPLYADILERMRIDVRYVLIERNPLAVIASLAKRDRFTTCFSALLWLRHGLEAEHATRGRPRVFLSYEDMLDDWRNGIEAITNALSINWPRSEMEWQATLSNHFSENHQHHVASAYQLEADPNVNDWIKQAYRAVRALEKDRADGAAMLQLDMVRGSFDSLGPVFGDAFFSEMSARERAAAERFELQRHAADQRMMELEETRIGAATRETQLTQQLRDFQLRDVETTAREADLMAQVDHEARRANGAEKRIQDLIEESERLKVEIHQIRSSSWWRVTYPARYLASLPGAFARWRKRQSTKK